MSKSFMIFFNYRSSPKQKHLQSKAKRLHICLAFDCKCNVRVTDSYFFFDAAFASVVVFFSVARTIRALKRSTRPAVSITLSAPV